MQGQRQRRKQLSPSFHRSCCAFGDWLPLYSHDGLRSPPRLLSQVRRSIPAAVQLKSNNPLAAKLTAGMIYTQQISLASSPAPPDPPPPLPPPPPPPPALSPPLPSPSSAPSLPPLANTRRRIVVYNAITSRASVHCPGCVAPRRASHPLVGATLSSGVTGRLSVPQCHGFNGPLLAMELHTQQLPPALRVARPRTPPLRSRSSAQRAHEQIGSNGHAMQVFSNPLLKMLECSDSVQIEGWTVAAILGIYAFAWCLV